MSRETVRTKQTSLCWCGCGQQTAAGKHFVPGHDRKAEAALVRLEYGSIAELLAHHGFGPEKSVVAAAEKMRARDA